MSMTSDILANIGKGIGLLPVATVGLWRKNFYGNNNQNTIIFTEENAFENVVCKIISFGL